MSRTIEEVVREGYGAVAERRGPSDVESHGSTVDEPPTDDSVDCVISDGVINLAPDKPAAFRDDFRVLKPGGPPVLDAACAPAPKLNDVHGGLVELLKKFDAYAAGVQAHALKP